MSIQVLLADDHEIMLEGLKQLLRNTGDIDVIGVVKDGRTTVATALKCRPDITIMDISMPSLNGIEATRKITEELPDIKIIILSMHTGQEFISEALRAGAHGYVLKECAFEELTEAIYTVYNNKMYLSRDITGTVVRDYVRKITSDNTPVATQLTDREREVLQLIAEGNSTKEIASILYVSGKTIDTYRRNLMKKLNMKSIAELTKYAIRAGFTSLE